MQVTLKAKELRTALARLRKVREKRQTMPVLSCARIEATGQTVRLAATDLEVGLTLELAASVREWGAVVVDVDTLRAALPKKGNAPVTLRSCGAAGSPAIRIESDTVATLAAVDVGEYPTLPEALDVPTLELSAGELARVLGAVAHAMSVDETRYNLNGVYLELEGGLLRAVATDGHRMALAETVAATPPGWPEQHPIMPRSGVLVALDVLKRAEGTVSLGVSGSSLSIELPGVRLVCRTIDGEYPNYRQVVPKSNGTAVHVPRVELAEAVRAVGALAPERSMAIRLEAENGALRLSTQNVDLGEAERSVAVERLGDFAPSGFNARYLAEALEALSGGTATLHCADALSPVSIDSPEGDGTLMVVMPMRP